WPRASRGMLTLRRAVSAAGASDAACRAALGEAAAGVILSAIWAMKTPSPAMIAAVITMLRMTPHSLPRPFGDFTTPPATGRLSGRRRGRHFREKDERRVNAVLCPPRLDPARGQRAGRIFRPGMPGIAPAQIGAHGSIAAAPKTRQVARHLHRPLCRRQQFEHQRHLALG